jgi:histidinol-phosphate aminotransferase
MPDWQHRILSRWRSTVPAARTPRFRSVLDRFTAYKPGRVPVSPHGRSFKLSSNESPSGPLPSVVEVITAAAADVNRYPDNHAQALTGAISTRFGVPPEHVAVGCGSVGLTQQLLEAAAEPGGQVLYAWRSFEAYPLLADLSGAASVRVPLRDERHDLAAMAGAITEHTRVVFVCNPNNPTGTAVRRDELEEFLDRVPPDCLVVLDEAYREYVRDPGVPDGLSLYPGRPNVAVLRTFSKAYGLAGLRVGFLVAAEPVAAAVRMTMLPFTVNHLARAARPGRRGGRRAGPRTRRADQRRLVRAAHRSQLRLAAAGRGHRALRRRMRGRRGQHPAVRRRGRPGVDRRPRGQRGVPGRRQGLPAPSLGPAPQPAHDHSERLPPYAVRGRDRPGPATFRPSAGAAAGYVAGLRSSFSTISR